MSFRARLLLGAAYLVTAVVLALEIPLALNIQRRADSDFQAAVFGRAALLSAQVSDAVANADATGNPSVPATLSRGAAAGVQSAGERVVVTDVGGRVLADTAEDAVVGSPFATPQRPEFGVAIGDGRVDFRRRHSNTLGTDLLLVTVPVVDKGLVVGAVRMSSPHGVVEARVHRSWARLAAIGVAVVLGALLLGWILASTVARPLARLRDTAGRLEHGDLDARASTDGPKELAELGVSFNSMAEAMATSLRAQREFVANASHQLRTPLTGLKLRLEALRREGGKVGDDAAKAEQELDRLGSLVDDMLDLASAATSAPTGASVDLAAVVDEAVERWRGPADEAAKSVQAGRHESVQVFADPSDLAHIVDNLIENALRYAPPGATVTVESAAEDGRATLAVADDGPGIPAADRARVFERFYRGANGKQSGPGTGLGLAIVAELVERWGGRVSLDEGPGTRVEAEFRWPPADR
ncbi:MAG TPA: HAMP domain-containing sensor histidine kinase [Gaiellaceae bacterium]